MKKDQPLKDTEAIGYEPVATPQVSLFCLSVCLMYRRLFTHKCLFYQAGQEMEPLTVPSHVVYRQKREVSKAIEDLNQNHLGSARVRDE